MACSKDNRRTRCVLYLIEQRRMFIREFLFCPSNRAAVESRENGPEGTIHYFPIAEKTTLDQRKFRFKTLDSNSWLGDFDVIDLERLR